MVLRHMTSALMILLGLATSAMICYALVILMVECSGYAGKLMSSALSSDRYK